LKTVCSPDGNAVTISWSNKEWWRCEMALTI